MRRPFGRLVRHFLDRMVRGGQDAASSELELGGGALIGLLAAPGAFTCLLLLDKYSAFLNWMRGRLGDDLYITSVPDKFLFLSVAMAVVGIATVLKWDQILPDAQDYLNLAPLPVRPVRILLANATAIVIAVGVVAIAVNAIPVVLFPVFVTAAARSTLTAFAGFAAVHALCVVLATVFSICAMFTILGIFAAVLPRDVFRTASSWLRGALLLGLLGLLLAGFAGPAILRQVERTPETLLRYLPPVWYLSLYQVVQHRATAVQRTLASWAWIASLTAPAVMAIAYGLSYRRRFAGVLEGARPPAESRVLRLCFAVLDAFAPRRAGFARACHIFAVRAMLRNEAHRLAIAVAIGLGYLLAIQSAAAPGPVSQFAAPLTAAYLLILGVRIALELPAGVPPNWLFRVVLDSREAETLPVARRLILAFLVPVVLVPAFAFACWRFGFAVAVVETAYVVALCLCWIEVLLAGYRKVPLTCPMPGFRDNALMMCVLLLVGFLAFTHFGATLELWMFDRPWRFFLVPIAMAWAWHWNRGRLRAAWEAGEVEEGVTFENAPVRAVTRLDLSA
jgi:hypothetical protein